MRVWQWRQMVRKFHITAHAYRAREIVGSYDFDISSSSFAEARTKALDLLAIMHGAGADRVVELTITDSAEHSHDWLDDYESHEVTFL